MAKLKLTPRAAFTLFISLTVVLAVQAVWWIYFMATLIDEKVDLARELGADESFVEMLHQQEIRRQIMIGSEGLFFLFLIGVGAWLIYRALVRTEELKFHQQNFLMAVTHELKTPLASMKIYLDSLQSPKISAERKAGIVPNLQKDASRLERLVENILDAGRFERSGYQLNPQLFDLSAQIRSQLTRLESYPLGRPIKTRGDNVEPSISCYGDPAALRRAVDAILENCVKYNDKETVEVEATLKRIGKSIQLTITDNGIGLNRADQTQIFNRFYRVGKELERSSSGSGLGLYLCREIVKAHGGQVAAESKGVGKGVTFTIKLKANSSHEDNSAG